MDLDKERIFLSRIVVRGEQEPALDLEVAILPGEGNGIAPGGLEAIVEVGELEEARGVCRVDGRILLGARGKDFGRRIELTGLKDEERTI